MRVFAEGEFTIRFAGHGMIPADVVAESLAGWSGIYVRVPAVLGELHPAFRHMRLVPFVECIEHGTLVARVVARLLAKSDADAEAMELSIDRWSHDSVDTLLRNIQRMNTPGKLAVAATVGAIGMYGLSNLSGYLDGHNRTIIRNASGLVINNSAVHLNIDPARASEIVELATRDNVRLTRQTLSAFRPAAVLDAGVVQIGDEDTDIVVPADAAQLAGRMDPGELRPRIETRHFTQTRVDIRAIDLDRKKSGWGVIVPAVSTNRVSLTVADSVSLEKVGQFIADVDVDFAIDLDGNEKPRKAHLRAVHEIAPP